MIRLPEVGLEAAVEAKLRAYQAEVDAAGDYAARIDAANERFAARNRRGDATFDRVKQALQAMCSGVRRCAYCEDSAADEVEHHRPKILYPEYVFAWPNYLYACGPCNGSKGSRYAVFPTGQHEPVDVSRKRGEPVAPPVEGDPLLLDPRSEDAMKWMMIDLRGETFRFVALAVEVARAYARARYTIEVLRLNRDVLVGARKAAFKDYLAHLRHYVAEKQRGASHEALAELRDDILRRQHPTVWREMQRQHDKLPSLRQLFRAAPEAISWSLHL